MQPGQHRETARVLLHDGKRNVFLLLTHFDPEVGLPPRWITPGGGIDEGETPIQAAVRELTEETGIRVSAEQLGEPVWVTRGRWDWGDGLNFHTYVDHFFQLDITSIGLNSGATGGDEPSHCIQAPTNSTQTSLPTPIFALDQTGWTADERRDVLDFAWWQLDDLLQSNETFGPPELTNWLRSWHG